MDMGCEISELCGHGCVRFQSFVDMGGTLLATAGFQDSNTFHKAIF